MIRPISVALALAGTAGLAAPCSSQIVQRNQQHTLVAPYNNAFYDTHPEAARSFYAAHYAHFGVYEAGMRGASGLPGRMRTLEREVHALIQSPPRFEPPIDVIAPGWSRIAYQTGAAMDWTHDLHEQLYDILTDDAVVDKQGAGERAISYYLTKLDGAFATRGYGHAFMLGGGSWSGTFARSFPTVNGILWSYHWHHAAVYEALLEPEPAARSRALAHVLETFVDSVLVSPPTTMPLTAQVAPKFGEMFPAAAHIFDNLHMMHDVVNDIMVDGGIPLSRKSHEIDRMLRQMLYVNQDWVIPPPPGEHAHGAMPMGGMPMGGMRVPTQLPDGRWLPQGHPRAALGGMDR